MRLVLAALHAITALRFSKDAQCDPRFGYGRTFQLMSSILITGQLFFSHANRERLCRRGMNDLWISHVMRHVLRPRLAEGRLVMLGVLPPRRQGRFCYFAVSLRPS